MNFKVYHKQSKNKSGVLYIFYGDIGYICVKQEKLLR